jgi:hypothetical protein
MENYSPAGRSGVFSVPDADGEENADLRVLFQGFADTAVSAEGDELTGDYDITGTLTADVFVGKNVIVICTSGTRPGTPVEGQHIYETDTNQTLKYDGSGWVQVGGGSTLHPFMLMGA